MSTFPGTEIMDFQNGEGRYRDCYNVPEMIDKFVSIACCEKWNAESLYHQIVSAISDSEASGLVMCDLLSGLFRNGYEKNLGIEIAHAEMIIVAAGNPEGYIGLLSVLYKNGSNQARAELEKIADQNDGSRFCEWAKRSLNPQSGFLGV